MLLADSCFNFTHDSFKNDLDSVINDSISSNVKYLFCPASREIEVEDILITCEKKPENIFAGVGIHPHYSSELKPDTYKNLKRHANHNSVKAIGEIGLDYFRNLQSHEIQKKCFETLLDLAVETKLPAFLHHRDAFSDFYPILRNTIDLLPPSIVHCFTGTKEELKSFLDLGLYIGITGWICDPRRGNEVKSLLKYIPKDRILIETDAPYLLPKDLNPKPKNNRNVPKYLNHILFAIAQEIDISDEELGAVTTNNFKLLFKI
tara:strand:- start:2458 stop:3243 length:786 start_codon:yes stop_codon:yes gene_type:complete